MAQWQKAAYEKIQHWQQTSQLDEFGMTPPLHILSLSQTPSNTDMLLALMDAGKRGDLMRHWQWIWSSKEESEIGRVIR
eukprot:scaffold15825_cov105-Cylindrotheca_fusiformis.AAC.1